MKVAARQQYVRAEAAAGRGKLIELTKGFVALVDDVDFEAVNAYNWYAQGTGSSKERFYAARRVGRRILLLHRELLGAINSEQKVDHKNRNTFDYRRVNLRFVTDQQNSANQGKRSGTTTQYKGVCRVKPRVNATNPYMAYIGGAAKSVLKRIHLGYFASEEEAARVADAAAKEHYGEFAVLNFP